ncbi:hypothetical protein B8W95_13795, partial [Staphylococcus pasteuri]
GCGSSSSKVGGRSYSTVEGSAGGGVEVSAAEVGVVATAAVAILARSFSTGRAKAVRVVALEQQFAARWKRSEGL